MATRDNYQIQFNNLDELRMNLNLLLQRLADRMDKIEGIRGDPVIDGNLSLNGNRLIDVLQSAASTDGVNQSELADQDLDTTDSPTFASLTITATLTVSGNFTVGGDLTIMGTTATGDYISTGDVKVKDSNDVVLHSFEVG